MLLAVVGIAARTFGAYALSRALRQLLFGVAPTNPGTYVAAVLVALCIAMAAYTIPARAATRVTPVDALRSE
ncbi:MAG: hypothetical protein ACRELE_11220 [Gemmatimonadales bacterium]